METCCSLVFGNKIVHRLFTSLFRSYTAAADREGVKVVAGCPDSGRTEFCAEHTYAQLAPAPITNVVGVLIIRPTSNRLFEPLDKLRLWPITFSLQLYSMSANGVRRRRVDVGPEDRPLDAQQAQEKLHAGTLRLAYSGTNFLTRNLKAGEEETVAKGLRRFFREKSRDVTQ